MGIELNTEQVFALMKAENWYHKMDKQTFEISGGAGTGKSTLVRFIIDRLKLSYDEVLFVSFSGKAVSRLAKEGLPARTIHSTIYNFKYEIDRDEEGNIIYNKNNKPKLKPVFELKERYELHKGIKLFVVDEGSMVEEKIAKDLLSFNIPTIVLGDLNQLPPVFGESIFLKNPDVILSKIMRQEENDPIVYLANRVLNNQELKPGVYGISSVMNKKDLQAFILKKSDIVITGTNNLRYNVNTWFRKEVRKIQDLSYPHLDEKIICRKNNWDIPIDKKRGIYLTNGTTGTCDAYDRSSYDGISMKIDFKPDIGTKVLKDLRIDFHRMYTQGLIEDKRDVDKKFVRLEEFEYAYAITCHSSQGSEYDNVVVLVEQFGSSDMYKRFLYTAITRAKKSITLVF